MSVSSEIRQTDTCQEFEIISRVHRYKGIFRVMHCFSTLSLVLFKFLVNSKVISEIVGSGNSLTPGGQGTIDELLVIILPIAHIWRMHTDNECSHSGTDENRALFTTTHWINEEQRCQKIPSTMQSRYLTFLSNSKHIQLPKMCT